MSSIPCAAWKGKFVMWPVFSCNVDLVITAKVCSVTSLEVTQTVVRIGVEILAYYLVFIIVR